MMVEPNRSAPIQHRKFTIGCRKRESGRRESGIMSSLEFDTRGRSAIAIDQTSHSPVAGPPSLTHLQVDWVDCLQSCDSQTEIAQLLLLLPQNTFGIAAYPFYARRNARQYCRGRRGDIQPTEVQFIDVVRQQTGDDKRIAGYVG